MPSKSRASRSVVFSPVHACAILAALAWLGCSSSSPGQAPYAVIGPAGGTVTAGNGSSVVVPPGALTAATTITMTPLPSSSVPGQGAIGAAYALSPPGLRFATPVSVRLAFDPNTLPEGTSASELAVYTAGSGITGHAFWLASTLSDSAHVVARALSLEWFWIAGPLSADLQVPGPPVTCDSSGAVCVNLDVDDGGFCSLCQCDDGTECPGSDPTQCCACPGGFACPFNDPALCGACDAAAPSAVRGVPMQSLGVNCGSDSAVCSVCPAEDPVACATDLCCPLAYPVCCGDGESCATTRSDCANAPGASDASDPGAGGD